MIRPVPYLAAFVISSLAMKPSGMAVTVGSVDFNPLDDDDPLRALRGQHNGEIATKILEVLLERKGLHAIQ